MERRTGGAALCWAGLEQISRLADSGGKGSDVSVIRDLAWEQGLQRNLCVSGITKKVGRGLVNKVDGEVHLLLNLEGTKIFVVLGLSLPPERKMVLQSF